MPGRHVLRHVPVKHMPVKHMPVRHMLGYMLKHVPDM